MTDPMVGITTCVQYALAAAGIEEPDLQKLTPFIGPPLKQSFMEFYGFSDEKAEQAVENTGSVLRMWAFLKMKFTRVSRSCFLP